MSETTRFQRATSWHEVGSVAHERGVHAVFVERVRDMARHASMAGVSIPGCVGVGLDFDRVQVASDWPSRGSITLTRTDGSRWRLYMTPRRRTFKVRRVK